MSPSPSRTLLHRIDLPSQVVQKSIFILTHLFTSDPCLTPISSLFFSSAPLRLPQVYSLYSRRTYAYSPRCTCIRPLQHVINRMTPLESFSFRSCIGEDSEATGITQKRWPIEILILIHFRYPHIFREPLSQTPKDREALVSPNDGDPEPSCPDEGIREDGDKGKEGRPESILSPI